MELDDFPSASARDTLAFCWEQIGDQRRRLVASWVVICLAVITSDLVAPLIFATILGRVAELPAHPVGGEWRQFGAPRRTPRRVPSHPGTARRDTPRSPRACRSCPQSCAPGAMASMTGHPQIRPSSAERARRLPTPCAGTDPTW